MWNGVLQSLHEMEEKSLEDVVEKRNEEHFYNTSRMKRNILSTAYTVNQLVSIVALEKYVTQKQQVASSRLKHRKISLRKCIPKKDASTQIPFLLALN